MAGPKPYLSARQAFMYVVAVVTVPVVAGLVLVGHTSEARAGRSLPASLKDASRETGAQNPSEIRSRGGYILTKSSVSIRMSCAADFQRSSGDSEADHPYGPQTDWVWPASNRVGIRCGCGSSHVDFFSLFCS